MSTSKNNIQRNVLAPDILIPSLLVGVAWSRLGYAQNANTFVIYFGHALKLVQSSFPKSLSRESAKHGMGITTEHFISEQIARPKWRVGSYRRSSKVWDKKQAATPMNNTGCYQVFP